MEQLRQITGYIALAALFVFWVRQLLRTAPQRRRATRPPELVWQVLAIRTGAFLVAGLAVVEIHFLADSLWHVVFTALATTAGLLLLRREHRRLLAPETARLPLFHPAYVREDLPSRHRM